MFEETFSNSANVILGSSIFPLDLEGVSRDRTYRGCGVSPDANNMVFLQTIRVFNAGCETGELPLLVISHDQSEFTVPDHGRTRMGLEQR